MSQRVMETLCDRCGRSGCYIRINGTNGMIGWAADVCKFCFEDLKDFMINQRNSGRPKPLPDQG